jgi:glycosyltransferase involved in cell wall biosynthesis
LRLALTVESLGSQLGGIGRYTLQLCRGLQRNTEVTDLLFYRNGRWITDLDGLLHDEEIARRVPRLLPKFWRARQERRKYQTHVFHGTNFFLPPQASVGVITVHDLSVMRFPELHPEARIRAFDQELLPSIARAAHIITPSETIRREVIDLSGRHADQVTAVPLAAGHEYKPRPAADLSETLSGWGLAPDGYGLSVATIEPRKKLEQSLAAWERLEAKLRRQFPLVIVGADGWKNDSIRVRIDRGVEEGWVRNLGYIPEHALPLLYSGARLLLYPSTYEGFGLPAVEAMASGIPCVISGKSSVREVTGGAAMEVDPDDVVAFTAALERALVDEEWRVQARLEGLRIASTYSWERCLSETISIYRSVSQSAG